MDSRPDINEKRRSRTGLRVEGGEEEVLCPRPRRPTTVNCPTNEFMKPSRRHKRYAPGKICVFILLDYVKRYGCSLSACFRVSL